MKIISFVSILVYKIIVQTNLNNEYLRRPNHFQVFDFRAFVVIGIPRF